MRANASNATYSGEKKRGDHRGQRGEELGSVSESSRKSKKKNKSKRKGFLLSQEEERRLFEKILKGEEGTPARSFWNPRQGTIDWYGGRVI